METVEDSFHTLKQKLKNMETVEDSFHTLKQKLKKHGNRRRQLPYP